MAWDKIKFMGEDSDGCIYSVMTGLSQISDPEEAMREFCKAHLQNAASLGMSYCAEFPQQLYSHYVFSGPINGSYGNTAYAQKFAKFLKDEKLGEVIHGEPVDNKKYHPGRMGQVFIWIPNQKAVEKWWTANNPERKTAKDKVTGSVKK